MTWQHEAMRPEPGRESLDEWLAKVDDLLAEGRIARAKWLSKFTWHEGDVTITPVRWDDGEIEVVEDCHGAGTQAETGRGR